MRRNLHPVGRLAQRVECARQEEHRQEHGVAHHGEDRCRIEPRGHGNPEGGKDGAARSIAASSSSVETKPGARPPVERTGGPPPPGKGLERARGYLAERDGRPRHRGDQDRLEEPELPVEHDHDGGESRGEQERKPEHARERCTGRYSPPPSCELPPMPAPRTKR